MKATPSIPSVASPPRHVVPSEGDSVTSTIPLMADEQYALKRIQSSRAAQKKPISFKQLTDILFFSSDRRDWKSLVATTYDEWWRDHLTNGERIMSYAQGARCFAHERPSMTDRCVDFLRPPCETFPSSPNGIDFTSHARHQLVTTIFCSGSSAQIITAIPLVVDHADTAKEPDEDIVWRSTEVSDVIRLREDLNPVRVPIIQAWERALDGAERTGGLSGGHLLASRVLFNMGVHHPTGESWAETMVSGLAPQRRDRPGQFRLKTIGENHERSRHFLTWCAQQIDQDPLVIVRHPVIMNGLANVAFQGTLPGADPDPEYVHRDQTQACQLMAMVTKCASEHHNLT